MFDFSVRASRAAVFGFLVAVASGCGKQETSVGGGAIVADSLPVFVGDSLPFRYPPAMYIQRVQDNVTLRMYLDEFGRPVPESTRIAEHALNAVFDTSALAGAIDLVFRPAIRDGKPMPYPVLFPIKFRVPNGPPMPGDTVASPAQ